MKRLILLVLLFVVACGGAPPLPEDLCSNFDSTQSFLLKVSAEHKIPLNEVYYGILDVAIMSEAISKDPNKMKEFYREYLDDVGAWWKENYPKGLTWDQLIYYMTAKDVWGDRINLILPVISRRVGFYRSNARIVPWDGCALEKGWKNAYMELGL